jgi:hypothetical protein
LRSIRIAEEKQVCFLIEILSLKGLEINIISYINVQKSTDFKSQEKRERKHLCSWGERGRGGQIGRKKERKKGKKE